MVDFAYIERVLPLYERAAVLTVQLGIEGILLSIVTGLFCALILYEKIPVLRRFVIIYIEVSRNTPLLVQLFFIYYGLPKIGIVLTPKVCGVAGLAFLGGSYMAEAFRSGLDSVENIQRESAYSLGMNRMQAMRSSFITIRLLWIKECTIKSLPAERCWMKRLIKNRVSMS